MDRIHAVCMAGAVALVATGFLFVPLPPALAQGGADAAGIAAGPPAGGAPPDKTHGLTQDVLQVIGWLPDDTESISLARGPLQGGIVQDYREPVTAAAGGTDRPLDFRQEALAASAGLFGMSGKTFIRNINAHEVRFVLSAARHFGPPAIGRASKYEGAHIIVFGEAFPDVAVQPRTGEQGSLVRMEGNAVVRLDTKEVWGLEDDQFTIYYAKPKPSVLVAATDAGFLKTMLQRVDRRPVERSPLLDFPQWNFVDTRAPVWGVRHRRTATPIYFLAKSGGLPFSDLSGISFTYEPQPGPRVAYQLHFAKKARDAVRQAVTDNSDDRVRLVTPLVTETWLSIRTAAAKGGPEAVAPHLAVFMVQHLMGNMVCP